MIIVATPHYAIGCRHRHAAAATADWRYAATITSYAMPLLLSYYHAATYANTIRRLLLRDEPAIPPRRAAAAAFHFSLIIVCHIL